MVLGAISSLAIIMLMKRKLAKRKLGLKRIYAPSLRAQQLFSRIKDSQKTPFTLLVRMRQTVLFRVISARLHMKGQPLYGCLTLHNGIWKSIKRKINPQIKIRQIVKLNDKFNKNK